MIWIIVIVIVVIILVANWGWGALVAVIGGIILLAYFANKSTKKNDAIRKEALKNLGFDSVDLFGGGMYSGGHPDIDQPGSGQMATRDGHIIIFSADQLNPSIIGKIPMMKITNILVEDATTTSKRVSVGRLLAVGVFALAWKKKDVKEECFMVIEWNDGRFAHESIFKFSGDGATTRCNEVRNKLMKRTRDYETTING